jgi:predicted nucleic acid-binding protein
VRDRALADTGALLALASPEDQYHRTAIETARRFLRTGGRFVSTVLVLGELHTLLLHRRGRDDARRLLAVFLGDEAYQWLDVSVALTRDAASNWNERFADQDFSLCDAVSFEVMRREKIAAAFAFDAHFVTAGFDLLGHARSR